jgi:ribosomal protein S18 acetylase RimI-like enzyme
VNITLRESQTSDFHFLQEMLFEAVYWRSILNSNQPTFEVGLADPEVHKVLDQWGERAGDTAVVALVDSNRAGAAWYRYWTDDNFIRGYIEKTIPVLVIAVQDGFRCRGIGEKMMEWLIKRASRQNIPELSLMVSKDNQAIHLYKKCGFLEYADVGESYLMVREL